MLDINVKTIDGQSRSYSVPDNYTVRQFKEKIGNSLNIPIERQRLIFQGRELKDGSSLSEFDVNGKTLHLVQRLPPPAGGAAPQPDSAHTHAASGGGANNQPNAAANQMHQLISQLIGGLGEFGQNATFNATNNGETNGMEVHIDLGNVSQIINENDIRARIRNIRRFLSMSEARLNRLHDIQSGAPLDDTSNSTIIVGSVHTTTAITDGNQIIGFETNSQNLRNPFDSLAQHITRQLIRPPAPPTTTASSAPGAATTTAANAANAPQVHPLHFIQHQAATAAAAAAAAAAAVAAQQQHQQHPPPTPPSSQSQSQTSTPPSMSQNDADSATTTTTTTTTTTVNDGVTETTTESTTRPAEENRQQPGGANTRPASQQQQSIGVEVLADIIQSVMNTYTRFMPYLEQYHTMLVNDMNEPSTDPPSSTTTPSSESATTTTTTSETTPTPAPSTNEAAQNSHQYGPNVIVIGGGADNRRQRFFNNINDMMHLMGHLMHNISDLHVNIRDRPPRQIHTMSSMSSNAAAQTQAIIGASTMPLEATIQIPIMAQLGPEGIQLQPAPPLPNQTPAAPSTTTSTNTTTNRQRSSQSFTAPSTTTHTDSSTTQQNQTQQPTAANNQSQQPQQQPQQGAPQMRPQIIRPVGMQRMPLFGSGGGGGIGFPPMPPPSPFGQFPPSQMRLPPFLSAHGGLPPPPPPPPPLHHHHHPQSMQTSYDPYLPCNSVHFYNSFQNLPSNPSRRRHPAGEQQQPQGPNIRITQSTTVLPTPEGQQQQQQQQLPGSGPTAGAAQAGANAANALFNIVNQSAPLIMNQLSSLFGGGGGGLGGLAGLAGLGGNPARFSQQQRPAATTTTTNPQQQQQQPNSQGLNQSQVLGSILSEALNLMNAPQSSPNAQQRLNQPMRDFLTLLGEDSSDEIALNRHEQPSLINAFSTFFHSLSLGDLIDLSRGQNLHRVFERTRQPLREHLLTYCPNSQLDIDYLCNRYWEDIFEDESGLNIDFSQFELTDERIDLKKSVEKLVKEQARATFDHIFDTRYDNVNVDQATETWSSVLYARYRTEMDRIVNLFRACVRNADTRLVALASDRVNSALVQGSALLSIGPMFARFEDFVRSHIHSILASVSTNRSSIEQFIVYKQEPAQPQSVITTNTATTTSESASKPSAPTTLVEEKTTPNDEDEDDDNQSIDSNQFDSVSSTLSGNSMDIDHHFADARNKRLPENSAQQSQQRATTSGGVRSGSELPSEWMPIIERDLEKQRKKSQEESSAASASSSGGGQKTSFSDAYISGMPAKKRKILTSSNATANTSDENMKRQMLKTVLERTMEQVELKPNANRDELIKSSLDDSELVESFDNEFDSALTDRLRSDQDFLSIIKSQQSPDEQQSTSDNGVYNKNRFACIRKQHNFK